MNVRQVNSTLWLATAVCAALAVLSLALGLAMPLDDSSQETSAGRKQQPTTKGQAAGSPTLDSFEKIASRTLRSPLTDSAPAPGSVAGGMTIAQQSDSAPVLVGTIGDSLAMFRMPDGSISLKGVGDKLDGADVVAIRPEQVDMLVAGRQFTLAKPKPPAAPGGSIESGRTP
jgi:hypothetical protein